MAIKKQEFYEGAALHQLARRGKVRSLRYKPPFFHVNEDFIVLLKYCTKTRSPWAFTFTPEEQQLLGSTAQGSRVAIGLVCGADGIVSLDYHAFSRIVGRRTIAARVACFRLHREHYEVSGPEGVLPRKVAPSDWQRILEV